MILNDRQIIELCKKGMITPFSESLVRQIDDRRLISFGMSSYGYDIPLATTNLRVVKGGYKLIDPKKFDESVLEELPLQQDENGDKYFVVPAYGCVLGHSLPRFNLPRNVTGNCVGKSTYARVFLHVIVTPLEAGWSGYLTIEMINHTPNPLKVYAEEGIAQVQFFMGEDCEVSYADRGGKYQNQAAEVVVARV